MKKAARLLYIATFLTVWSCSDDKPSSVIQEPPKTGSVSLDRTAWRFSSIPTPILLSFAGDKQAATETKAELWWYNPGGVIQEWDLDPTLERPRGEDNVQALELTMFPTLEQDSTWAGIAQSLSPRGMDLSEYALLRVWVNDFVPFERRAERTGILRLDLGTVGEDAIWHRNDPIHGQVRGIVPPNGRLDSEDTDGNGSLASSQTRDEDTGLDGLANKDGDTSFDDYAPPGAGEPFPYRSINGMEGNHVLDTEDLNGDRRLNQTESYFEITLDLANEALWAIDVRRDYVLSHPPRSVQKVPATDSGWRLIEVPLRSELTTREISSTQGWPPDWKRIHHARISIEIPSVRTGAVRYQISGLELVTADR